MANTILEQLEELYFRWSMAEKVGKEMQLEGMWQQLSSSYNYLYQMYLQRGYLMPDEICYANQLSQILTGLKAQKMQVDQELSREMMRYLAKMIAKRNMRSSFLHAGGAEMWKKGLLHIRIDEFKR